MSTYTDANPLLKRYILFDLFAAMDYPDDAQFMLDSVRMRASRLAQRGVDWREHRVRSKRYRGKLGDLYDSVKKFSSVVQR